jgi:TolB-like protein/class 3 adenylate cyclase/tetratricopeptide (TPR) repeat protein
LVREQRRLAAIVAADVVGYSRLMGRDESGTLALLREHRLQRLEPALARHGGRLVKLTGDGVLVEFPSAVDALSATIEFQQAMAEANLGQSADIAIVFRIGLHLGDLIVDGDDLYGDGVNVAARLEAEAPPGGIVISRNVQEAVAGRLKASFDDLGALSLKNIERPIQAFRVKWDAAEWNVAPLTAAPVVAVPAQPLDAPLALPDKPSIAVLPFQNMSGDPEQEYFTDGMVEEIITALSRFKSLFVIARNSSFTYKGKTVDIKRVGRELGVRYVLEGSVRKAGGRVRITGQLIDSQSGAHLWADRFDGLLEDVFDLQDQVTTSVVGAIVPALNSAELQRAKRTPVESLDAYDCFLRANAIARQFTQEASTQALHLYYRAIELDPDFATPYGSATHCYSSSKLQGWTFERKQAEAEVRRLCERVSALGQNDAWALCSAGFSLVWICREYAAGAAFVERATQANPNLANAWMQRGAVSTFCGEHEAALDQFVRARRICPVGSDFHLTQGYAGISHLFTDEYEEAARCGLDASSHLPNWLVGPMVSAAANGLMGNAVEAVKALAQLRRIRPGLTLSSLGEIFTYRRPEDLPKLAEGLRLAGLPE